MSNLGRKIILNSYYGFIMKTLNGLSRFVSSIAIARVLGPSETGTYAIALFIYYTAEIIANLGIENVITKYISQFSRETDRTHVEKIISYAIKVKLLQTILVLVLTGFASGYLADFYFDSRLRRYIIFMALILIPGGIALVFQSIMQGFQEYKALAMRSVIVAPLQLILTVVSLYSGLEIMGLIAANLIVAIIDFVVYYVFVKNKIKFHFTFRGSFRNDFSKRVFTYNWQIASIVLLNAVVWERSEIFFLGRLSTQAEVAFYSLSHNFTSWTVGFLPGIITGALFPAVSALYGSNDNESIRRLYLASTRCLMMLCIPVTLAGIGLSRNIVNILYGPPYTPMISVLNILLGSTCLSLVLSPSAGVLYSIEKQGLILKSIIVAASANIILSWTLIAYYGAVGAAIANSTAQITAVLIITFAVCRLLLIRFPILDLFKISFSSIVTLVIIICLGKVDNGIVGLILSVLVGVPVYSTLLIYTKVLTISDIQYLQDMKEVLPPLLQSQFLKLMQFVSKLISQKGCL